MGIIPIHAYYVPYLDHSILSTSDLNDQGLYMNEGTKYLEDQHGHPEASFTHEKTFNWLPSRHVVFPPNIPSSVFNHLSTFSWPDPSFIRPRQRCLTIPVSEEQNLSKHRC